MVSQLQTVSRGDGIPAFNIGVGPVGVHTMQAGMLLDGAGAIFAVENGSPVAHQGGIGFDLNGRMSITTINAVDFRGAGATPFDTVGNLCVGGATNLIYMGVALASDGKVASS